METASSQFSLHFQTSSTKTDAMQQILLGCKDERDRSIIIRMESKLMSIYPVKGERTGTVMEISSLEKAHSRALVNSLFFSSDAYIVLKLNNMNIVIE